MALGNRIAAMSQGVIRQLGTPEQIYREPANIEIARLFGDPTINLLDVKPARDAKGIYVGLSNVQVHLAGAFEAALGRDCVIGLRPEALSFVGEATPGAIPVTVEAETPLNEKIVTLVRTVRGAKSWSRARLERRPGRGQGPYRRRQQKRAVVRSRERRAHRRQQGRQFAQRRSGMSQAPSPFPASTNSTVRSTVACMR